NEKEIKCLKNDLKQIRDESDVVEKRLKKINDDRKKEIKLKDDRIADLEQENLELMKQKKYCNRNSSSIIPSSFSSKIDVSTLVDQHVVSVYPNNESQNSSSI
ncbi:13315_t:CDS:2, partial [Dentiscutata heterogama]